jgi:hypothetical protein
MNKPRVKYVDCMPVQTDDSATVYTRDHYKPKLSGWIRTSNVKSIVFTPNGPVFETRNTVYEPYTVEDPTLTQETALDHQI